MISNTTGSDGIRILDTGDDSIQIGSPPDVANYGVYIPSPGVSTYGLWSNTANASGQWALYSVDNIQAGNVLANAYSLVAKVSGDQALNVGDVVAVSGMAEPIPGATDHLPQVRLADAAVYNGVIGVVSSRMIWQLAPGKEAEGAYAMQNAEGPAQPGDYVSLVVFGVVEVKVAADAAIQPGDRLTASSRAGHGACAGISGDQWDEGGGRRAGVWHCAGGPRQGQSDDIRFRYAPLGGCHAQNDVDPIGGPGIIGHRCPDCGAGERLGNLRHPLVDGGRRRWDESGW